MSDEEALGRLSRLTPTERAVVATLALSRLDKFPRGARFSAAFPGIEEHFTQSVTTSISLVKGEEVEEWILTYLRNRHRVLTFEDDEPMEEPDGPAAWLFDAVDIADYVIAAWHGLEENLEWCGEALSALDSFAGMLDDMPPTLRDGYFASLSER
ncbi:hypothetical protein [Streptomyces smaragdinus]|uniref:hypothetical protein n=1 Tax=Streptomyces smaragdinus TaxID=2585196 RepID=UPI001295F9AD|nr:hypothetical protein [Streptomyces smaragdinus]